MATPIRETIARAIYSLDHPQTDGCSWAADWLTATTMPGSDLPVDKAKRAADAVLRALDEAGCVVVRKEASDAMVEAHMGECAGDADEAGPDRIRGAWSAMISASVVE